jgi:integrase/recombinase XerC
MFSTDASRTAAPTQNRTSAAYDASELKIIQEQAGHAHASTTSIYTCVSSDYRTRTLRRALDQTITSALDAGGPR